MPSIFELCQPREDVLAGRVRDEELVADLRAVVNGTAPKEYNDPATFFGHTYPTRGLKSLLEAVCRRVSGAGGELNSVIRLDTQYGGGKTHALVALVHAVRGMKGVDQPGTFVDPALLPQPGAVRLAALDGENADPTNGLTLEPDLKAYTLWGEMAYRLAGREGFARLAESDAKHVAPGAETIAELFGGQPALILIDEISAYLRKTAAANPAAAGQFTAFIHALIKAVTSTPGAALVSTLAVRADSGEASDAYQSEQQAAAQAFAEAFAEAESIVSRTLLQLDPTEEDETVNVLRRRLFDTVDEARARKVVDEYAGIWERNREHLPADASSAEVRDQFVKGYPFHPETLGVMVEKLSSLANFQRTRGMLRLLVRTVKRLWETRPSDAHAIHPHHIDLTHGPIREELTTRLRQQGYSAALSADVGAESGRDKAVAQQIDAERFAGLPPITSYVARTVFLHTLAYGNSAKGLTAEHLRYSVTSPAIEPAIVDEARKAFAEKALYLDDRPGAPLRFQVEPNLNQIIQREMQEVDAAEVRARLDDTIRRLFTAKQGGFNLEAFPGGPHEVPDEVGNGRPYLVVLHYDAHPLDTSPDHLPSDLIRMATVKGVRDEPRLFRNNAVFLVADAPHTNEMKSRMRRRLAVERIRNSDRTQELAEYQQNQINEQYRKLESDVAQAIHHCYRHLYFPSGAPIAPGQAKLNHTTVDIPSASEAIGKAQEYIKRALRNQKKLLASGDNPDAPVYVRDQTLLKTRGEISTLELRNEFRKSPNLSILLDDEPLVQCIKDGIEQDVFIYREGEQLWGKGDPPPAIRLTSDAYVHTMANAKEKGLWPRKPPEPEPEPVSDHVERGTEAPYRPGGGAVPGGAPTGAASPPLAPMLSAEGAMRQALQELFEQAQGRNVKALRSMTFRVFNASDARLVQKGLAACRNAEIRTEVTAALTGEGFEEFHVHFKGSFKEANSLYSNLDAWIRRSEDFDYKATHTLSFDPPLSTSKASADQFRDMLSKHGGGEVDIVAEQAVEEAS